MKKKKLLRLVERHLEERIIDPCGYNPEDESFSDLVTMVKALSHQNEELLKTIREEQYKAVKKIPEKRPRKKYYWAYRNADGPGWVLEKILLTAKEAYIRHKDKDEYRCAKYSTPGYLATVRN